MTLRDLPLLDVLRPVQGHVGFLVVIPVSSGFVAGARYKNVREMY
jgi:hypothetical protein